MYAVASKSKDQKEVMVLHPWLSGGTTTYDSYLAERDAYGLSRVMDRWKRQKAAKTHFFVIATNSVSNVIGGPWEDFFKAGSLAWIYERKKKYIIKHKDTEEIDLDSTFGDGKKFWFKGFIGWEWSEAVGYYVGIEGNDHDPRIWAAFGPNAPRDAMMGIFALCSVISGASFRAVTSKIPECQNHSGEFRLWKQNEDKFWNLIFNGSDPICVDTAEWPYLATLLRYPNRSFSAVDLGLMDRLPDTEMPNFQAKSEFAELPEEDFNRKKSSNNMLSSVSREERAMWDTIEEYLQLLNKRKYLKEKMVNAKEDDVASIIEDLKNIKAKLESSSYRGIEWRQGESEVEHVFRLEKILHSRDSRESDIPEIKRARQRATAAISREIDMQLDSHPFLGNYLKTNVIPSRGHWTFVGKEDWKFTPPDRGSGKT
jgi:hypothetical protein